MENPSSSQEPEVTSCGQDQALEPSLLTLISSNNVFSDSADYVQLLLKKEISTQTLSHTIDTGRLQAVDYILNTREILGLHFQTAYLSITYLDQFLSQRALQSEKPWAMHLLSVGCLSLAAKVQEPNSWGLSSFQGGEFRFEVKSIQRMELLILYTLDWKMSLITPFDYIPYFISILFSKTPPWITLNKILELVMGIVKGVSLMGHYPSAIALAAVLLSKDQKLTSNSLELKINSMPCSRFLDLEDVTSCYCMMQKSERGQSDTPKLPSSPDLSPVSLSKMGRNPPDTSSISSKRKRLEFDDTEDQKQQGSNT